MVTFTATLVFFPGSRVWIKGGENSKMKSEQFWVQVKVICERGEFPVDRMVKLEK